MTTEWRYFVSVSDENENDPEGAAEAGLEGIYRLPVNAPVSLLEALSTTRCAWVPSDLMWRARYLGSDYEFAEISPERAQALLEHWVEAGWLTSFPSDESMVTGELAEYLAGLDFQARGQWSGVVTPPGAEDVADGQEHPVPWWKRLGRGDRPDR